LVIILSSQRWLSPTAQTTSCRLSLQMAVVQSLTGLEVANDGLDRLASFE
jgi:hypothetical protein